jgi:hypothetical protein
MSFGGYGAATAGSEFPNLPALFLNVMEDELMHSTSWPAPGTAGEALQGFD